MSTHNHKNMIWVLIRIASILMSTHNICFYGEQMKIVLELSSNTHLICSTELHLVANLLRIHTVFFFKKYVSKDFLVCAQNIVCVLHDLW